MCYRVRKYTWKVSKKLATWFPPLSASSLLNCYFLFFFSILAVIKAPTVHICPEVVLLHKYQPKSTVQVQFRC